jgi:type II restriction enzyme
VIQERKPLSPSARRAGWIGCNLLLGGIPPEGRITIIENGISVPRASSRALFAATERLGKQPIRNRSWSRALLNCLHQLPTPRFTLEQAYRPNIRQQLQVLRDAGLILFEGRGTYRLIYGAKGTKDALL